jgi:hypothetical protein
MIAEDGRFYAYAIHVMEYTNLVSKLNIPNIVSANVFPTKKSAFAYVDYWNESFKKRGSYMFDETF